VISLYLGELNGSDFSIRKNNRAEINALKMLPVSPWGRMVAWALSLTRLYAIFEKSQLLIVRSQRVFEATVSSLA
jgi:hypothetical protein